MIQTCSTLDGGAWAERALPLNWPPQASERTATQSQAFITTPTALSPTGHRWGVLMLSGGAQTRWGAHRQHVLMARTLAEHGHASLRFDWPGLGDADGNWSSFDMAAQGIAQVLDLMLQALPDLQGVVLMGLCDGASAALLHQAAHRDARVRGLVLINPWMRTEQSLAQAQLKHYYTRRLLQKDFWLKLLQGGVGWQALRGLLDKLGATSGKAADLAAYPTRMARGWRDHPGPILLIISEADLTGQEFLQQARTATWWGRRLDTNDVALHLLPDADHTCSTPQAQQALIHAVVTWLASRR